MASDKEKKQKLVEFLERRAFEPVLRASPDEYDEADRDKLEDVKRSTENEKRRYRDNYQTAEEVRDNYLSDLQSDSGKKKTRELEELGLPSLPAIKDEFLSLCDDLGVRRS